MKPLSVIAENVHESATLAMDNLYKKMKAEGIDVLGFAAGEPDFPTPDNIKLAGINAILSNATRYTPATGTIQLKEAVCQRILADTGVQYEPSQIIVSSGAKHCLYIILQTLLNPGDEVIIPTPAWVSYNEMTKLTGGIPVCIPCPESDQFKLTPEKLEDAITCRTKCILFNNPSNPTGMVYTKEELTALAEVCVENDLYIVADEIYCNLLYDGASFTSIVSLGEEVKKRTILVNGVSKSYAMTGWRIGYLAADTSISKFMARYLSHSTGNPSSPAQVAAIEALTGRQDTVEGMRQAFEERRNYMVERMNQLPGISCLKPQGAFYVMMNISSLLDTTMFGREIKSADDFCDLFLKEGLVCTVPCTAFGAPEFVRWSYATSMENIQKGLDRLEQFLAEA